uniref:BPTI/Kunitz inhibitor domain-containing protein n=1 Tax=Plectus sambesii TaxID=2011161 RepID=A0A914XDA9_9BILA
MSQCEQYRPGTCAPPNNANRFDSKLACEASCQNVPPCPPPLETKPGCGLVFQGLDQTTQCPIEQEMCEEAGMNCTSMQCSPGTTCTIMNGRARCMSGGKLENSNKLNKCSLLPDKGKCLASITRWYYNRQAGHCMQFAYGGCGGNLNRYNTLEQCERTCGDGGVPPCPTVTPPPVPSDCRLEGTELDTDLCPVPKIVCDRRNNCAVMHCPADSPCQMIDGLARCVKKPRDTHQLLLCSQLPDAGVGFESVQKWTYNRFTSRCEQFTYSGQGGNANRFLSKEQCEERCRGVEQCPMISVPARQPGCHYEGHETNRDTLCPQPKLVCGNERDVCADANCDPNSICQVVDGRAQCMPKEGVNGHVENEQALQLCSRLAQRGPCPAIIARWHYNRQTSRCEKFVYGGCQGNENNFETQSACERVCAGVARCPVTSALPAPVGCRHEGEELSDSLCPVPKLVCDEEEACKVCLTRESCQMTKSGAICQPATMSSLNTPLPNECELAKDSGSCDDQLPAFYFDSGAGKCLEFTYSGCQGNENRFSTLKQCERVCVAKRQCIIPPMVPPPAGCDYAISNDEEGCPIRHKLVCAHRMVIHN